VDHLAKGNIAEFARQLKVPRNTLWLWCQGNNRPTFTKLVEICFCLGVSLSDFLMVDISLKRHQKVQLPPTKHQPTSRADAKPLDLQSIKFYLKEILDSDKQPYPSLEQVARTLGRDRRTIAKHLPELCHAIATRYLNQRQAIKLGAIADCCREVRQAVVELHTKGVYPSEARIAELLTRPGFLRYTEVREAFRAARQEVGLEPKPVK
jgi:transcriptional regulator with XRE-family HTH domain